MKKFYLLIFFILGSFSIYSQTPMTFTFIGKDSLTQNLISLDSVYVKNLTENCDTLLFGPVPVLTLIASWPVGIGEKNDNNSGSFVLKQNYPNPFQGTTIVSIYREYGGTLNLILFDELGAKLSEYHHEFEKGFNSFVISSSENKMLILSVFDEKNNRSIKIISAGQGNSNNTIQYLGHIPDFEKNNLKDQNNSQFIFYLGNQMMYTAYSNGYNEKILYDSPIASKTYYFNMTMYYLPSVTTSPVTNITQTSATCGGDVTSDGGTAVTSKGICWGTSPAPTIAGNHTMDGSGTGPFISYLTGLSPNTQYYVRAYGTNSVGTGYGNEVTFTTGQSTTPPVVTTAAVTNITQTTATSGGTVTSDGGAAVTARGVCWSTSSGPTTAGSHTIDGTGTGTFVSNITGLTGGTLYYVRAYATNSVGTSYGNELTFTTLNLPTVTTAAITNITQTTATSGGTVLSDGGATVTARGVCWSTTSGPTISGNHTIDGTGTGTFVSNLTGLTGGTLYYVRAYATNSIGTSYGNELTFTTSNSGGQPCPGMPTVTYEGKTYNTVQIGTQCWFKENLNVGTKILGSQSQTNNGIKEKYCYADMESNCDVYGGLYQWDEAMQYSPTAGVSGLCPSGWHIPTDTEWDTLNNYLGGASVAGGKMKEMGLVHWASPNTSATNSSGFTGLPGGYYSSNLTFNGYFWSSSENVSNAWARYLSYNYPDLSKDQYIKTKAHSVRCIQGPEPNYYIGKNYGGGKIFYIDGAGQGGFISSLSDLSLAPWGCNNYPISGTSGSLGGGQSSTYAIVNQCPEVGIAAKNCVNLVLNSYSDWFLPSNGEITQLCQQQYYISSFASGWYWASTDNSGGTAYDWSFYSCSWNNAYHNISENVRAIRAFPWATLSTNTLTNISYGTATSGGNITSDGGGSVISRGVCWNTSPNPTTGNSHTTDGSGTGSFISNISGLTANTLYYVRAYSTNNFGTTFGNQVSFTTLVWTCPTSITVNHNTSGGVAPVNKTVTYGIVTNVPGEPSKCWITSNLGADHQATAKNDATEPSAGWYWQFNRKQGYKHDGTTRTPNTTWITPISENSDWVLANDPCALELGTGWRIPTYTEWSNLILYGGWYSWNDTWNSSLKLHAAGYLTATNGSLLARGSYGQYWDSQQNNNDQGSYLFFWASQCQIYNSLKTTGNTIRCILFY